MPFHRVTEVQLRLVNCKEEYEILAKKLRSLDSSIDFDSGYTVQKEGKSNDLYVRCPLDVVEERFGKVQYIQFVGQLVQLSDSLVPKSLVNSVDDVVIV